MQMPSDHGPIRTNEQVSLAPQYFTRNRSNLGVFERFPAANNDHRRSTFLDRRDALLNTQSGTFARTATTAAQQFQTEHDSTLPVSLKSSGHQVARRIEC